MFAKLFTVWTLPPNLPLIIVYLGYLLFQLAHAYIFFFLHPWIEGKENTTKWSQK